MTFKQGRVEIWLLKDFLSLTVQIQWAAAKEFILSYHNSETILLTIYPYYGNLT